MRPLFYYFAFSFFLCSLYSNAQETSFKVIPLGVKGGLDESNLSAYLVAPKNTENYICLDAGTVYTGISKAIHFGAIKGEVGSFFQNNIKGYLISHAHLDHVSGLIMNAPADSPKTIYSSQFVIAIFKSHYFSWKNWANFTDEGEKPQLGTYHYQPLTTQKEYPIKNTELHVTSFSLSHTNPYKSQAFLIRHHSNYILYLGDTGADAIEKSAQLSLLWKEIAPLITSKQLKAIFIEVSFPNSQENTKLYGHLKPSLFYDEMNVLAKHTGINSLNGFPMIITHRKPHKNNEEVIKRELLEANTLHLKLIFPEQGKILEF